MPRLAPSSAPASQPPKARKRSSMGGKRWVSRRVLRVSFAIHSSTRSTRALRPRSTRTLAIAAALSFAPAHAQVSDELRLRIEKQLHMAPIRPERDSAKFLEADRIEGRENKNMVATGNVTLRSRGVNIRADRLDYYDDDQLAIATGNVKIDREGDTATGPRLEYRLDEDTGEMDAPVFEFPKKPERKSASRGQAERALLEEDRKSKLIKAEYTSCPVPRDDWFLRVNELEVDSSRN